MIHEKPDVKMLCQCIFNAKTMNKVLLEMEGSERPLLFAVNLHRCWVRTQISISVTFGHCWELEV